MKLQILVQSLSFNAPSSLLSSSPIFLLRTFMWLVPRKLACFRGITFNVQSWTHYRFSRISLSSSLFKEPSPSERQEQQACQNTSNCSLTPPFPLTSLFSISNQLPRPGSNFPGAYLAFLVYSDQDESLSSHL